MWSPTSPAQKHLRRMGHVAHMSHIHRKGTVGSLASICYNGTHARTDASTEGRKRTRRHTGCHRPSQASSLTGSRGRQREGLALQTRTDATEQPLVLGRWLADASGLGDSGGVVLHAGYWRSVLCIIPVDCAATLMRPMRSRLKRASMQQSTSSARLKWIF